MPADETESPSLEARFAALAGDLQRAAADLRNGTLPDLAGVAREALSLDESFRAESASLGIETAALSAVRRARLLARRAEAALATLARLEHRDGIGSPQLAAVRQRRDELCRRLGAPAPLDAADTEPLVALAELLERAAALTDEEAAQLAETIARGLGAAVAVAALRGALRLAAPPAEARSAVATPPAVAADPVPPSPAREAANGEAPRDDSLMREASTRDAAAREAPVRESPAPGHPIGESGPRDVPSPESQVGRAAIQEPPQTVMPDEGTSIAESRPQVPVALEASTGARGAGVGAASPPEFGAASDLVERQHFGPASDPAPAPHLAVASDVAHAAPPAPPSDLAAVPHLAPAPDLALAPDVGRPPTDDPRTPEAPAGRAAAPATVTAPTPSTIPAWSPHDERLRREFWHLLRADRCGLAYQVARVLEAPPVPVAVVKAAALGLALVAPGGALATVLRETFAAIALAERGAPGEHDALGATDGGANGAPVSRDRAHDLLLAAAALRPSLLAWRTGAPAALRSVALPGALRRLADVVLRAGERLNGCVPSRVTGVAAAREWEARREALAEETRAFRARASARAMRLAHTRDMWRALTSPGGVVHRLFPADAFEMADLPRLHVALDALDIEEAIDAADRSVRIVHQRPLGGLARAWMAEDLREAISLAEQWIALFDVRPSLGEQVEQCLGDAHRGLEVLLPEAIAELDALAAGADAAGAAGRVLRGALEGLPRLLAPAGPLAGGAGSAEELSPQDLLGTDLLLGDVPLTDALEPEGTAEEIRTALVALLDGPVDWAAAYRRHVARGDTLAAGRILRRMERVAPGEADALREITRLEVTERRADVQRSLEQTRSAVEQAAAHGWLREDERADMDARLVALALAGDGPGRGSQARAEVAAIQEALAARRIEETAIRRTRLERSRLPEPVRAHVDARLAHGDLLAADEDVARAEAGATLDDLTELGDVFAEFFPGRVGALERAVGADLLRPPTSPFGPPDAPREASEAGRPRGGEMVASFYELKLRRELDAGHVRVILHALGFPPVRAEPSSPSSLDVVGEPIRDRRRVPLDAFGSYANGRYRILGLWQWPSEEDLLARLGDTATQPATIALFFGRLGVERRRELARIARARRRTFVVIDEIALAFLATARGPRLPILFRLALPFAHYEPYDTTPGLVSEEMFFGREREAVLIAQGSGPCFVHGAPQSGKTALLRHVERARHAPLAGSIVRWIDLKAERIGAADTAEDLWPRLARELVDTGILARRLPLIRAGRVAESIKLWLDGSLSRRFHVLLDGADLFLAQDAQEQFRVTLALRDLIEETEGRFKVVFAGGVGVFRASHLARHPLAAFGPSIALGPLCEGADVRAAHALVEEPLGVLGYRFRSPGSPARVLAHAGHDPALVQRFGGLLLRHLSASPEAGPPYWIAPDQVETVATSAEWREAVRQRLASVLALDARYEVIAGALGLAVLERRIGLDVGAPVDWFRAHAGRWWPDGLPAIQDGELETLLEEMSGLGILRARARGQFAFRDPRIILAIGSAHDVEAALRRRRESAGPSALVAS